MRLSPALASLCLAAVATLAHADTYTVYQLNSTFNGPAPTTGTISGTVTYDNTSGLFTASTLVTSNFPTTDGSNGQPLSGVYYQGPDPSGFYAVQFGNSTGAGFQLDLPGTFATMSSVAICTTASNQANCVASGYANTGFSYSAVSGTLTAQPPSAATPEPSGLVLLGTGILGIAGAVRRRLL